MHQNESQDHPYSKDLGLQGTLECLIDETMVISETMSYFARNAKRDDCNKRDNRIFRKYLEVRRWENLSETMVYFEKLIKCVI